MGMLTHHWVSPIWQTELRNMVRRPEIDHDREFAALRCGKPALGILRLIVLGRISENNYLTKAIYNHMKPRLQHVGSKPSVPSQHVHLCTLIESSWYLQVFSWGWQPHEQPRTSITVSVYTNKSMFEGHNTVLLVQRRPISKGLLLQTIGELRLQQEQSCLFLNLGFSSMRGSAVGECSLNIIVLKSAHSM